MQISAVSASGFLVSWSAPQASDHNGNIRSYIINITEENTGRLQQFTSNTNSLRVESRHPYYNYTCQVSAVTVAAGPYSPPTTITTLEDGNASIKSGGREVADPGGGFCSPSSVVYLATTTWLTILTHRPLTSMHEFTSCIFLPDRQSLFIHCVHNYFSANWVSCKPDCCGCFVHVHSAHLGPSPCPQTQWNHH